MILTPKQLLMIAFLLEATSFIAGLILSAPYKWCRNNFALVIGMLFFFFTLGTMAFLVHDTVLKVKFVIFLSAVIPGGVCWLIFKAQARREEKLLKAAKKCPHCGFVGKMDTHL